MVDIIRVPAGEWCQSAAGVLGWEVGVGGWVEGLEEERGMTEVVQEEGRGREGRMEALILFFPV